MPVYEFSVWSTSNLLPSAGSTAITTSQLDGTAQVGDTFTIGTEAEQTIAIEDNVNVFFEDDPSAQQFLDEELVIGGFTYPAGTQVQNEFTLLTDQLDDDGNNIEIIVIRFETADGTRTTTAYALSAPIPAGTEITIIGEEGNNAGSDAQQYPSILCFAAGTRIMTVAGAKAIERLSPGDGVLTMDHGQQCVRWVGCQKVGKEALSARPKLRPIRISAGALGQKAPEQELLVSPQHRIFVRSKIAERMFGETEVLVHAKDLLALEGVDIAADLDEVTYVHLMCDAHEIVQANGAYAETLHTGQEALKTLSDDDREEIVQIFGSLPLTVRPLARSTASGKRSRKLIARHTKNQRALVDQGLKQAQRDSGPQPLI